MAGAQSANHERNARTKLLFWWLAGAAGGGLLVLFAYSLNRSVSCGGTQPCTPGVTHFLGTLGSLLMASFAALGAGALVGFLFGVPRYKTERSVSGAPGAASSGAEQGAAAYKPNTNLEEISDWLTKLFVGATLVEVGKIPGMLARFGRYFAAVPGDEHVVVSSAIYFAILGFFIAFFYASLELAETLNMPSALQETFSARAPLAESSTVNTLEGMQGPALDEARNALAQAISTTAVLPQVTEKDVAFAVAELRRLAERYEGIRRDLAPSDDRTVKMEGVVAQMRLVAPAALQEMTQFQSSVIAGERLACTIMLQIKPDGAHLNWLVDRFRGERPFVQYHAALALRSAGRQLTDQTPRVREAVENALDILRATLGPAPVPGQTTSDRERLLLQVKAELAGGSR